MRRVNIGSSYSELVIVGDQYEAYIEEHLGVADRNHLLRVGSDGAKPLIIGQYRNIYYFRTDKESLLAN